MHILIKRRTNTYRLDYYLSWTVKDKLDVFDTPKKLQELNKILINIARRKGVDIKHIELESNSISMLISFPPNHAPSSIEKSLKGTSAREWFKLHPELRNSLNNLWNPNFFIETIGVMSKNIQKKGNSHDRN